ncbi:MAG: GntR family transcriptional regulator [Acetobacteraceae bacterium]|nr:GntR family transcriptional regulator [Acetobacteraceae bacterium]
MSWSLPPREPLPEAVAARVVEAMRAGELLPGQRIVEATLAAKLGVSRGPLREALKSLEAEQLVERRPGKGARVASINEDQAAQMVVARAGIEGLAARLVAAQGDGAALDLLAQQHARIRLAETARERREADWFFHELVMRSAQNAFLLRAWLSLANRVRLFLHRHPAYEGGGGAVITNHERLLDALRGDPAAAEATFRAVILESGFSRLGRPVPASLRMSA